MLEKQISFDAQDGWGPDYVNIHGQTLEKLAADCYTPQSLVEVMEKLRPRPEGRYILLNALGAYEYWGFNANGDAFPEWSLKGEEPPASVRAIIDHKVKKKIPGYTVPSGRYGHKTFVTDAHVFVQHKNSNPALSIGDVIASAYNDKMHRVELIVFVYKDRHPELVDKIDAGEYVPFSMGSKLAFDICSVCLNTARTRGEYCEHLRYSLKQTLPDGRRVFSYNFFPRFFDISYVRVPADKSAWQLKKVASTNLILPPEKKYSIKLADMVKKEPSVAKNLGSAPINPDLVNFLVTKGQQKYRSCEEDPALVAAAKGFKLKKILATLSSMGILLHPKEVTKLSSSEGLSSTTSFSIDDVDTTLMRRLQPFVAKRSFYDPHFTKEAAAASEIKGSLSGTDSEPFQAYCQYLKTIDFEKLGEWVTTSAQAKLALDFDTFLFKVAGVHQQQEAPNWLPFFSTLLRLNDIF